MKTGNIIIDLDGTIYRGNRLVDHAESFFSMLNKNNVNYIFFTNCSKRVPAELVISLREMGLEVQENKIITSGCITRRYIQDADKCARIFVIGSSSFMEYLQVDNIELVNGTGSVADYVVIGFCNDFTYGDLTDALWHIQNGAKFIATNIDNTIPSGNSVVPHTGAICAFLECASKQKPLNLGKPSEYAGNYFRKLFGSEQVFVIGDRIDTDMLFAKKNGFIGCLVMTGITSQQDTDKSKRSYFNVFNDLQGFSKFIGYEI